jgi:hypothetical protein
LIYGVGIILLGVRRGKIRGKIRDRHFLFVIPKAIYYSAKLK